MLLGTKQYKTTHSVYFVNDNPFNAIQLHYYIK